MDLKAIWEMSAKLSHYPGTTTGAPHQARRTMNEDVQIVEAGADDAVVVVTLIDALLKELAGGETNAADPPPDDAITTARALLADDPIFSAFLAESASGEPIAVMTLAECASIYAKGRFAEIMELYVAPAWRSAGVGERLVAHACALGKRKGWTRIEVGAPDVPRWTRTVTFYKRLGFSEVGPRLKIVLDP